MAPLLRRAPPHSSGKARVCRRSASTGRSMGLAIIRVRSGRILLCRCKCATKLGASCPRHIGGRRQSTWRPKTPRRRRRSLHSAIEIASRGHRKLLELMAIRPRRGWVEQRVAAQERGAAFNRGRDVLPPWTPWTCPLRRRAAEHEAIWNPVAQECPLPSRVDCRPHSAQVCRRSVHAQDFDAAPSVPVPSRDWMLIFVGSFSALISAGMPDLSRGKS
jgi:hypothetical protein